MRRSILIIIIHFLLISCLRKGDQLTEENPSNKTSEPENSGNMSDVPMSGIEVVTEPEPNENGLRCYEIIFCHMENQCQDDVCWSSCLDQGGARAQQHYFAMAQCINESCVNSVCNDGTCLPEVANCYLGSCFGINYCFQLNQCGDDSCRQACLDQASRQAVSTYQSIQTCFRRVIDDGTCTSQDADCLQQNCSAEIQACDKI